MLVVNHEASRSGAPMVALSMVRVLRAAGYEVVVIQRWGGVLVREFDAAADVSQREPWSRLRAALRRLGARGVLGQRAERCAAALERLAAQRVLRRHRPDLVWANTAVSSNYLAPARQAGIATVWYLHETRRYQHELLARHGLVDAPDRLSGVRVLACSAAAADATATVTGLARGRVGVLHPSVSRPDRRPSSSAESSVVVMGCGNDPIRKGFDLFVDLARALSARHDHHLRFIWVGPGSVDQEFVEVTGAVTDAAARIASSDIFVLSSRADPFPLVVLEAMASSRCVVGFDVGGVAEQLGAAGVLIEPGRVEAMAEVISELAGDPERRSRLGADAHDRFEQCWSPERFTAGVLAVTRQVLDGGDPPAPISSTD